MFQQIIHVLAYGVLVFTIVEVYLTLNKLWSRKHIKEVADSISISARATGMIPGSVFTLNYFFEGQWQGFIDGAIWLGASVIQIMVAAGIWVAGNRRSGVFGLIKRAIQRESRELNNLAKYIFQVSSRRNILDLLAATALTDKVLESRERDFVDQLAESWGLTVDWETLIARFKKSDISALYNMSIEIRRYLQLNPTKKEIKLLAKFISQLSDESGHSRPENQFIIDECIKAFDHHPISECEAYFQVQIVPQESNQHERLQAASMDMKTKYVGSGLTYILEPVFTLNFAEHIITEFEELGYFATVKRISPQKKKMSTRCLNNPQVAFYG